MHTRAIACLWVAAAVPLTASSGGAAPPAPLYPCPPAHSWCHDSVAAADIELHRNITYGSAFNRLSGEAQTLLLDVYAPRKPRAAALPVVVLVHGGGWHASGDIGGKNTEKVALQAHSFARRGFVAISIDYRCERAFGGSWLWVDAVADARTALKWVAAHAEAYSLDISRLVVYGTSAGAITVEGLCYLEHQPGLPSPPNISAAISVSGALFNDTASICTPSEPAGSTCFPPPGRSVWNKLYRHTASPQSPPLIDFHGTADHTVPFDNATTRPAAKRNQSCSATDTQAFLSATGAPNDLVPIPGAGHVPLAQVFAFPANVSLWGFLVAKLAAGGQQLKTDDSSADPETGPHVGSFKMAPAKTVLGAYRNDSLNSWGGALLSRQSFTNPYSCTFGQKTEIMRVPCDWAAGKIRQQICTRII